MSFIPDHQSTPLKTNDTNRPNPRRITTYSRPKSIREPVYSVLSSEEERDERSDLHLFRMERIRSEQRPKQDEIGEIFDSDPPAEKGQPSRKGKAVEKQWGAKMAPLRHELRAGHRNDQMRRAEGSSKPSNSSPYKVGVSTLAKGVRGGVPIANSRMTIAMPSSKNNRQPTSISNARDDSFRNPQSGPSNHHSASVVRASREPLQSNTQAISDKAGYNRQGHRLQKATASTSYASEVQYVDHPQSQRPRQHGNSHDHVKHDRAEEHIVIATDHIYRESLSRSNSPNKSMLPPNHHDTRQARQRHLPLVPMHVTHPKEAVIFEGGRPRFSIASNSNAPIHVIDDADDGETYPRAQSSHQVRLRRDGHRPRPSVPIVDIPRSPPSRYAENTQMDSSEQGYPRTGVQTRGAAARSASPVEVNSSPSKRALTVGVGRGKGKAVPRIYSVESEEEREILETDGENEVQEQIESPDGYFPQDQERDGITWISSSQSPQKQTHLLSPIRGDRAVPRVQGSPDWPLNVNDVPEVSEVQGAKPRRSDAGKIATPKLWENAMDSINGDGVKRKGKAGISSTLTSSKKGLPDQTRAQVDLAWLSAWMIHLHIATVVIEKAAIVLHGKTGNPPAMCRLSMNNDILAVCADPSQSLVTIDFRRLDPKNRAEFTRIAGGYDATMSPDGLQIVIVFRSGSAEAFAFAETLMRHLRNNKIVPGQLPLQGALAIRTACPSPSQDRDTRSRTQQAKFEASAKAAEERLKAEPPKPRPKKRDSNASDNNVTTNGRKPRSKVDQVEANQSTLSFTKAPPKPATTEPPRRSARHTEVQSYAELNDPMAGPSEPRFMLSEAEKREKLFSWPPIGRADLNISRGDRERITSNEFLNDTLLEFGLRYVLDQLEKEPPPDGHAALADDIHLFNSFFYVKLIDQKHGKIPTLDSTQDWPAYDAVKRWTRNARIFDRKYVIVPINESYHWYFAIIVNPAGILKIPPDSAERGKTPTTPADGHAKSEEDVEQALIGSTFRRRDGVYDDDLLDEVVSTTGDKPDQGRDMDDLMDGQHPGDVTSASEDPLALEEGHDWQGNAMQDTTTDMRKMSLGSHRPLPKADPPGAFTSPFSAELDIFNNQFKEQSPAQSVGFETTQPPSPAQKRKAPLPDHKILDSDDCWIITVDSLGGPHTHVKTVLERWLHYEARDKRNVTHRISQAQYCEAKVPQQEDFHNCGLFLIHYAERFLRSPDEMLRFIEKRPRIGTAKAKWGEEKNLLWQNDLTGDLRVKWKSIIDHLATQQGVDPEKPGGVFGKGSTGAKVLEGGGEQVGEESIDEDTVLEISQLPVEGVEEEAAVGVVLEEAANGREGTADSLNSRGPPSTRGTSVSRMEEEVQVQGDKGMGDEDILPVDPDLEGAIAGVIVGQVGYENGHPMPGLLEEVDANESAGSYLQEDEDDDIRHSGVAEAGSGFGFDDLDQSEQVVLGESDLTSPAPRPRTPEPKLSSSPIPFPNVAAAQTPARQPSIGSDHSGTNNTSSSKYGYRHASGDGAEPPRKQSRTSPEDDISAISPMASLGSIVPGGGPQLGRQRQRWEDGARFSSDMAGVGVGDRGGHERQVGRDMEENGDGGGNSGPDFPARRTFSNPVRHQYSGPKHSRRIEEVARSSAESDGHMDKRVRGTEEPRKQSRQGAGGSAQKSRHTDQQPTRGKRLAVGETGASAMSPILFDSD